MVSLATLIFLLSAVIVMLLWAIIAPNFGIEKIDLLGPAVVPMAAVP